MTCLSLIVIGIAANHLVTQEVRVPVTMVLTKLSRNIPILTPGPLLLTWFNFKGAQKE